MKDHECQPSRCEYMVDNSKMYMLLSAFSDGLICVRTLFDFLACWLSQYGEGRYDVIIVSHRIYLSIHPSIHPSSHPSSYPPIDLLFVLFACQKKRNDNSAALHASPERLSFHGATYPFPCGILVGSSPAETKTPCSTLDIVSSRFLVILTFHPLPFLDWLRSWG